jgi:hypothetical protein
MPRGGERKGTQGKGYSNRTDLGQDYAAGGNPATGGMTPPAAQKSFMGPSIGADQVPNIFDPSDTNEPVTTGLDIGLGSGSEVVGPLPPNPTDPVRQAIQAMMLIAPNPDLVRVLNRLDYEGR